MSFGSFRSTLAGLVLVAVASGCSRRAPGPGPNDASSEHAIAPGVVLRRFENALGTGMPASVLDVDLGVPGVRLTVACERAALKGGRVVGDAYTVRDWCARQRAAGGVNGGFFGITDGDRKEVIGLLASRGGICSTGALVVPRSRPGRRFARCVLALGDDGTPRIGWAVGRRGRAALLTAFDAPENPARQRFWRVSAAVACGPRLIVRGRIRVTDREERLMSPPRRPRTFVGYSTQRGRPTRVALVAADSMTFVEAARFLQRYFRQHHAAACSEAMCLDGGSSSQMAYRTQDGYADAVFSGVTVPSALLVMAPRRVR